MSLELSATLAAGFPLSEQLGVRVRQATLDLVVLEAPLANNRNNQGSAFAGSLNAVATLAGWSWLWLLSQHHGLNADIVLHDSTIKYSWATTTDFEARCASPDAAVVARFLRAVRRRRRGRLQLTVELADWNGISARFEGRYVALVGVDQTNRPVNEKKPG